MYCLMPTCPLLHCFLEPKSRHDGGTILSCFLRGYGVVLEAVQGHYKNAQKPNNYYRFNKPFLKHYENSFKNIGVFGSKYDLAINPRADIFQKPWHFQWFSTHFWPHFLYASAPLPPSVHAVSLPSPLPAALLSKLRLRQRPEVMPRGYPSRRLSYLGKFGKHRLKRCRRW